MSSSSIDEDEPMVLLYDKNNEDYMETCDDEVNDMVPRLEKMNINDDNEPLNLASNNSNTVDFSNGHAKGKTLVHEVTKAALVRDKPLSETEETLHIIISNTQVDIHHQNVEKKASADSEVHKHPMDLKEEEQMLAKSDETGEIGAEDLRMKFPPDHNFDHSNETKSKPAPSEVKAELLSLSESPVTTDPETGEVQKDSNIILDRNDSTPNRLDQSSPEMAGFLTYDDSLKFSYFADVSSDQLSKSSGNMTNSSPDSDALNVDSGETRYRTFKHFPLPFSGITENVARKSSSSTMRPSRNVTETSKANSSDENLEKSSAIKKKTTVNPRQRRFSVFQTPSSLIDMTGASKANSSDEDEISRAVKKNRQINLRQKSFCIFQPPSEAIDLTKTSISNSSDEDSKKSNAIRKDRLTNSRQRRIGTFRTPNNISTVETSSIISSTDSEKSNPYWKVNPIKSQRKCRKCVKSFPKQTTLGPSSVNEERRPSPCKRKISISKSSTVKAGKFRKRSLSEHNTETAKKTCLSTRSRSLSPTSKNNTSDMNTNTKILNVQKSRKRAISHSETSSHNKCRRSSGSSDDTENK